MARYRIRHLTRYSYEEPVSVCHNLAHLLPRDSARHTWDTAQLTIRPAPAVLVERRDYFGNRLNFFGIQEPLRTLEVLVQSRVEVEPSSPLEPTASVPWECVRGWLAERPLGDALDAYQFTLESPFVKPPAEVELLAREIFLPNRPILEAALALNQHIFKMMTYDPRATQVTTTLAEVLMLKRGVCQDYAHLFVGCLRSLGLAVRYVSGYLLTQPPPGRPRMVGSDASHAWVSVYVPWASQYGQWIDLDPTNNLATSDKHVTVAWGRDFGDVSPLRGVILGGGRHGVHVGVDVIPE